MMKIQPPKFFRNWFILAFIGWTTLAVSSGIFFLRQDWQHALERGRNIGRSTIQKDYIYRLWNASHGGVYVPVSETTPPNPYLKHLKERDITTPSGILLTKINPAYMTRQTHEIGEKEYGIKGHITSLKLMRPENQADAWETQTLKKFNQGVKESSKLVKMDSEIPFMRLMLPLKTRQVCLNCHAHQDYKVGDIRGGISVAVPMQEILAATRQKMLLLGVYHTIIFLLGTLILSLFFVHGRKRLAEITQTNQKLKKSQQAWQMTFDAIPDIITLMDNDFLIVQANQAAYRLFGPQHEKIVGNKCYELYASRTAPCPACPALKALKDSKDHVEVIEHTKLGRTYLVTVGLITDDSGRLINLVHSARDISERVKLEEELFQTRKLEAIGTLAGGVAHDFNNILTVIRGHAELVMMQCDEQNQFWNDLKAIDAAGERASHLTRQLLAFSRKEKINPEIIQVNPLINNLYKMLKRLIGEEIDLKINLADNPPPILADRGQFEQLIINLVVNAADATCDIPLSQGRRVNIATTSATLPDDDSEINPVPALCFQVNDNGCGIPENILPLIFDPFFTTKESGKGTGLGLSTVHGIIEQNKALIEVDSQLGKGTTFTIYWPGIKTGPNAKNEHQDIKKIPGGSETILIAEDDQAARNLAVQTLQHAGYTVIEATNGQEAIAKADNYQETIDLLFSDLVMPKMGGIELSERMAQLYPGIKIILVSGYLGDRIDYDNETLQKTTFLNKPYKLPELLRTIRQLLD